MARCYLFSDYAILNWDYDCSMLFADLLPAPDVFVTTHIYIQLIKRVTLNLGCVAQRQVFTNQYDTFHCNNVGIRLECGIAALAK